MARRNLAATVVLEEEQRTELDSFAASRSLPHGLVVRAKIVLMAADGKNNVEIAEAVGMTRQTVATWRKRFVERALEGLYDEYRRGRPRSIDDEQIAELISKNMQ